MKNKNINDVKNEKVKSIIEKIDNSLKNKTASEKSVALQKIKQLLDEAIESKNIKKITNESDSESDSDDEIEFVSCKKIETKKEEIVSDSNSDSDYEFEKTSVSKKSEIKSPIKAKKKIIDKKVETQVEKAPTKAKKQVIKKKVENQIEKAKKQAIKKKVESDSESDSEFEEFEKEIKTKTQEQSLSDDESDVIFSDDDSVSLPCVGSKEVMKIPSDGINEKDLKSSKLIIIEKLKKCHTCDKYYNSSLVIKNTSLGGNACKHCLCWVAYELEYRLENDVKYEDYGFCIANYVLECYKDHDKKKCTRNGACFLCDYISGKEITNILNPELLEKKSSKKNNVRAITTLIMENDINPKKSLAELKITI